MEKLRTYRTWTREAMAQSLADLEQRKQWLIAGNASARRHGLPAPTSERELARMRGLIRTLRKNIAKRITPEQAARLLLDRPAPALIQSDEAQRLIDYVASQPALPATAKRKHRPRAKP